MKWQEKILLGRTDLLNVPEVGLFHIPARIDTGAAFCALHCNEAKMDEKSQSVLVTLDSMETYAFANFKQLAIKNSFGESQERMAVLLTIEIYGKAFKILVGLTTREKMRHPLLIGRNLIREGFVVDVKKRNLSYRYDMKSRL